MLKKGTDSSYAGRQTRARSRLPGAAPLMAGLDHKGLPVVAPVRPLGQPFEVLEGPYEEFHPLSEEELSETRDRESAPSPPSPIQAETPTPPSSPTPISIVWNGTPLTSEPGFDSSDEMGSTDFMSWDRSFVGAGSPPGLCTEADVNCEARGTKRERPEDEKTGCGSPPQKMARPSGAPEAPDNNPRSGHIRPNPTPGPQPTFTTDANAAIPTVQPLYPEVCLTESCEDHRDQSNEPSGYKDDDSDTHYSVQQERAASAPAILAITPNDKDWAPMVKPPPRRAASLGNLCPLLMKQAKHPEGDELMQDMSEYVPDHNRKDEYDPTTAPQDKRVIQRVVRYRPDHDYDEEYNPAAPVGAVNSIAGGGGWDDSGNEFHMHPQRHGEDPACRGFQRAQLHLAGAGSECAVCSSGNLQEYHGLQTQPWIQHSHVPQAIPHGPDDLHGQHPDGFGSQVNHSASPTGNLSIWPGESCWDARRGDKEILGDGVSYGSEDDDTDWDPEPDD